MKKSLITISMLVLAVLFSACGDDGGSSSDPNAGFKLATYAYNPLDNTVVVPTAGNVQGALLSTNGTTTGTVSSFNVNFGGVGLLVVTGAKVPGLWRFRLAPDFVPGSLCLQPGFNDLDMRLNDQKPIFCPGRIIGLTADPNSLDALNPPLTITFTGKGLENNYGEPVLAFYDEFGNLVASTQASQSLWSGGEIEGIVANVPNISGVYDGTYTVVVNNINADGTWAVVGAAPISIFGNPPPPPPDDGGGGGDDPGCDGSNICLEQ